MRLFLAIEPDATLRDGLARLRAALEPRLAGWRWARPEGIHLTLRFLGEVDPERDRATRDAWCRAAAAASPLSLRLSGVGRFPPRGAPRILWVGIDEAAAGDALAVLARRIESAARELGWAAEGRPFRPHLTLARAARGGRADPPPHEVEVPALETHVEEIVLFRSDLGPAGARYTALERFALGGGAAGSSDGVASGQEQR